MRLGRDTADPCTNCSAGVRMSEVTRWPEAIRAWWFVTGLCRKCQGVDGNA